jgi:small basic protein
MTIFGVESSIMLCKFAPNFFLHQFRINIIFDFVILWLQKKVGQQIFFSPLSFVTGFGSGMDKNRIRDKYPRSATLVLDLLDPEP